jgi:excisionase family DNA binding protein
MILGPPPGCSSVQKKQTTSGRSASTKRAGSNARDDGRSALEETLLTVGEVARMLHVSRSGIYWLVRGGDLPSIRIGHRVRFSAEAVRRYIRERSGPADAAPADRRTRRLHLREPKR